MDYRDPPNFINTLIGSLYSFKDYPRFAQRSGGSFFLHYVVLLTLVCSLYAGIATYGIHTHVVPYIDKAIDEVPQVTVTDGKATVEVEQPYELKIEGETILVIDTESDPQTYLEGDKPIMVLAEKQFYIKEQNGQTRSYPFKGDFQLDKEMLHGWVQVGKSWTLPVLFLCVALWQFFWKAVQVLIVAGLVTAMNKSEPPFGDNLKLAVCALGPALGWGLLVFVLGWTVFHIPGAGMIWWAIMVLLTLQASNQMKERLGDNTGFTRPDPTEPS